MSESEGPSGVSSNIKLTVKDPPDFNEGGSQHRRSVLASTALVIVLLLSPALDPVLFGVKVRPGMLWAGLSLAHVYFFLMWRLTAPIESDQDKRFWNIRGIIRQAFLRGTAGFPGKTKAQIMFLRALPIWAFLLGLGGIGIGVSRLAGAT